MDHNGHGDVLVFYVNGKRVAESNPDPEASLLQYLRRTLRLPGTKEGCGHGGCGSCTVMVSKYDAITKKISHYSVNACLFPLCAAHGLAITTVEGVGSPKTGLHEIQKRLVESHGLQCGFCTPGFVMSAFTLLRNNPHPTRDEVERALEGNLCRCTGYRPIIEALSGFTQEQCLMGEECCRNKKKGQEVDSVAETFCRDGDTQVPIFPSELHLPNELHSKFVHFCGGNDVKWYRPTTETGLVSLKDKFPEAPIIMGNTTLAQYMRQGKLSVVIYGGSIAGLKTVEATDVGLVFGAAVTLSELSDHLKTICCSVEEHRRRHFPSLMSMVDRYGSEQIRNVATLGGSIQSGRSNSDVITLLMALNASVTVNSVSGERTVPLEELSLKKNEVIWHVTIPYTQRTDVFEFYKQTDRRTFSLAIINSGMFVRLDGNKVKELRLTFGGVAPKAVLASKTASLAAGRDWDESMLHDLLPVLMEDLINSNKPRDEVYKVSVATAFLFKFFTAVGTTLLHKQDSGQVLREIPMPPSAGTQFYYPCTADDQSEEDPVGRPVPNVSSEAIVSGEAVYIDDIPSTQGELFLSLVLSSKAHANILNVDPSEALSLEGVHSYIDHTDIPGENKFGADNKNEEFLASKEVLYIGQPIGAILADTRELALRAAKLVKVEYEELDAILNIEGAINAGAFYSKPLKLDNGDTEKGFKEATHVIEGEVTTGFQEQFYMEPHSVLVIPKIENNEFEIVVANQILTTFQADMSSLLNVPRHKLTCKTKRIGGSFGGKEFRTYLSAAPAVVAAYKTKRPVRCILPRETDMLITGKRHPFLAKYKIGVDDEGKIKALEIDLFSNAGGTEDVSLMLVYIAVIGLENCYDIPNINIRGYSCKTNTPSNTAMRGFGKPQVVAIMEDIIFNVASTLNLSQEKIRECNLMKPGHVPATGTKFTNCTIKELWKQCMESSDYAKRRREIDDFNSTSKWKKRGIAMTTVSFGIGGMTVSLNQGHALVNIYLDGSVLVSHGGIEMGQGINTKVIQVASRALGVPINKIYTCETSTSVVPNHVMTGGSTTTDLYAPAVLNACNTLMERLKPIRAKYPDASWEELLQKAYDERVQLSATGCYKYDMKEDYDIEKKTGKTNNYFTYGVACSEVEIDVLTGENQVSRTDIVFDVGKSLNPAIDIGQIEGGFVQGMGMMTSEFTDVDENGRMINCSPLSYKIPNVRSIPRQFNVTLLKNYDFQTVIYSSKGIGEPPLVGSVSVLMAIKDAVLAARSQIGLKGHFRLDCPATVQRIRAACGDQLKK